MHTNVRHYFSEINSIFYFSSLLVHQDGQYFPDFNLEGKRVLYDRIVCDVPCSGDGTIRKNPTIWAKKWSPGKGNSR